MGSFETPGAFAPPAVTDSVQRPLSGSGPDLFPASAIRGKLKKKSYGGNFRIVVSVTSHPDAQSPQSLLWRLHKSRV